MKSRFDEILKPRRESESDVLTLSEAVGICRLSRAVLLKLIKSGELPGAQFGAVWRLPKKEFLAAFEKRLQGAYCAKVD